VSSVLQAQGSTPVWKGGRERGRREKIPERENIENEVEQHLKE
jgi:hypothetical protein